MLLVILGAGSSFDSVPSQHPNEVSPLDDRPPLADALFENRPVFREAMRSFPAIQPIVPLLQRRHGRSLEQQLQVLAGEAAEYPVRAQQLMAVRYYIQYVFRRIEDPWLRETAGLVTNVKTMLDELDRCVPKGHAIALVTFNYDRLIEHALKSRGIALRTIGDYVADERFKLFKVHGSIDWVRSTSALSAEVQPANQWGAVSAVIDQAAVLPLGEEIHLCNDYPSGMLNGHLVAPALAIPLEDKTDFECPETHLALLQDLLRAVTRILVVGWRATEQHFLKLLVALCPQAPAVFLACGTQAAGQATELNLRSAGLSFQAEIFNGGFTDLVTRRAYTEFLRNVVCR